MKKLSILEKQVLKVIILGRFPFVYNPVGNGIKIGKYTPDFVHIDPNRKMCIDVGNALFHRADETEMRSKYFKSMGWSGTYFITNRRSHDGFSDKEIDNIRDTISRLDTQRYDHPDNDKQLYDGKQHITWVGNRDTRRVLITVSERTWHEFKDTILDVQGIKKDKDTIIDAPATDGIPKGMLFSEIDAALQDRINTMRYIANRKKNAIVSGNTTIQSFK